VVRSVGAHVRIGGHPNAGAMYVYINLYTLGVPLTRNHLYICIYLCLLAYSGFIYIYTAVVRVAGAHLRIGGLSNAGRFYIYVYICTCAYVFSHVHTVDVRIYIRTVVFGLYMVLS